MVARSHAYIITRARTKFKLGSLKLSSMPRIKSIKKLLISILFKNFAVIHRFQSYPQLNI